MPKIDETTRARMYVLYNTATEELRQDQLLTSEEAQDFNERLAADGSDNRWIPWATREGDVAA